MNISNTTCAYCDKAIYKYNKGGRQNQAVYCSVECRDNGRRRRVDEILPEVQLLAQTMMIKDIAKKLGMSNDKLKSRVRSWRKRGFIIGAEPPRKLKPRTRKSAGDFFKWGCAEEMLTGDVAA